MRAREARPAGGSGMKNETDNAVARRQDRIMLVGLAFLALTVSAIILVTAMLSSIVDP